jgi:hypothetical protein
VKAHHLIAQEKKVAMHVGALISLGFLVACTVLYAFDVGYSMLVVCCLLFAICCLLFAACCLLVVC